MAAIGSIRKHGTLLIIVIGVALLAFILGDLSKSTGRSQQVNIGQVEGEDITIMDFNRQVEQNIAAAKQQQQKESMTADETFRIKEETWRYLVRKIIMEKEYEELGVAVSTMELADQIQGVNPHALIKQYFTDPNTGKYDRRLIVQYLQNLDKLDPEAKQQWLQFEKFIKDDRLRQKYNSLITQAYYVPAALAKLSYQDDNTTARITYVAARYQDLPDSLITVTDDDYAKYYDNNKDLFKEKETRDLSYVIFEVKPSMKDMQAARTEMNEIYKEFKATDDIARFVKLNSDNRYDSSWKAEGQLPVQVDTLMFNSEIGTVTEPYLENEEFHIARLVDVAYRPDSMKASHLLIAYKGALRANPQLTRTRAQAEKLADSLLKVVKKSPGRFETLITEFTDDPTVEQNKGDMGWFADGAMVWPFNEAVLKAKTGSITFAETPFGYHIIKVTGKKENVKKVRVAMIDHKVLASNQTYQQTFAMASQLASENKTEAEFNEAVIEGRLNKRSMPKIEKMSNYVAGLKNPRQVVRWAFNENTNVGDVSEVFDLEDMFVVATVTAKSAGGYPPLSEVKKRITVLVTNEVKGKYLAGQMKANNNNLDQLASEFNTDKVNVNAMTFNSRNLQGFGQERKVIGTIFGLDNGDISEPVPGKGAVFVVQVENMARAQDRENYTSTIKGMQTTFQQKVNQDAAYKALEESLDIEDNRIIFY
ncbi:MAG: SurA N-terminal domain-containing protein [Bacteroidales bacterium]|nr:SurA N-terminal domain-containing protein [Bacteroidales bacterium]